MREKSAESSGADAQGQGESTELDGSRDGVSPWRTGGQITGSLLQISLPQGAEFLRYRGGWMTGSWLDAITGGLLKTSPSRNEY
jgi:hypothetical protein